MRLRTKTTPETAKEWAQAKDWAVRFVPELVLFPEIEAPRRPPDYRNEHSLTNQDYYPRSLDLVLDNAQIVWRPDRKAALQSDKAGELLKSGDLKPEKSSGLKLDIFEGVRQSDRDEFWVNYRAVDKTKYPITTYVNVKRKGQLIVLQYWLFYLFNDFVNTHEGDWEHIDVLLLEHRDENGASEVTPVECACSSHHGGSRLVWDKVERLNEDGRKDKAGEHPVIYVALGSHANYFFGDQTYESGSVPDRTHRRQAYGQRPTNQVRPELKVIDLADSTGRPWSFRGFWGSPGIGRGLVRRLPILGTSWSGPTSPWTRPVWRDPEKWARTRCHDAAEHRVDFQPRLQRLALSLGPAVALLVPPVVYTLVVGQAQRSRWWAVTGMLVAICLALTLSGVRIREHDTFKVFRQRRPAGVTIRKRVFEPRFGWPSRIENLITFSTMAGSLFALGWIWYKIVGDSSSWFNMPVDLRAVQDTEVFATLAGLVPLILLILSTDQDLALVRSGWRRGWSLVLVAALLGSLIAAEVVALAMLAHEQGSRPTWGFPLVATTLAGSLTVLTWGIGWRIWDRYPEDVPSPNELEKSAFWFVGLATLAGISFTTAFAVLESTA